jgi:hypothetical protein
VLVVRVGSSALRAEPVEHGHAERADEVAVGAAARRGLAELEAEPAADLAGTCEEQAASGVRSSGGRVQKPETSTAVLSIVGSRVWRMDSIRSWS